MPKNKFQDVIFTIIMATIIVYLVAVVIIGVVCSKKNNAVDDFYLGGRKLCHMLMKYWRK